MKRLILFLTFISFPGLATDKTELLMEDPDKKIPKRASGVSEESEYLLKSGNTVQQPVEERQIKENQEETDPIFYDSTTSPAELEEVE
ncbi:MAG: hypothetical protein ACLGHN_15615 [Bacteriovoracia bacterium]